MAHDETDILIVGAGLAGAATAYHLARSAAGSIAIVEQELTAGVHSSGRNAAIVREHVTQPEIQPLLTQGAEVLRSGRLARFDRQGLLLLGLGEDDASKHFPRAVGTGRWCPEDGTVDVAGLLQTYLSGQRISFNTRVRGWERQDETLCVQTQHGTIACRILVNAAGPWAGRLGGLPLTPLNRHLFVTGPLDWVNGHLPCVWDGEHGLYFRPESGGLLLSACDETPAEPGDYRESPVELEHLANRIETLQPELGDLSIRSKWVGQRVFAPDRKFVIGFDPRDDRVFHVAGLGGHGVTASYAIGRLAARLIAGRLKQGPAEFDPGRLLKVHPGKLRIREPEVRDADHP